MLSRIVRALIGTLCGAAGVFFALVQIDFCERHRLIFPQLFEGCDASLRHYLNVGGLVILPVLAVVSWVAVLRSSTGSARWSIALIVAALVVIVSSQIELLGI